MDIHNKRELDNEIRMIQGNINRMCITDDEEELLSMYRYAQMRLTEIFLFNFLKLEEK